MPRFYFHLNNSDGWIRDEEGQELQGATRALEKAFLEARALIAHDILDGHPVNMSTYIAIEDESGRELGRVSYDEAVAFV